MKLFGIENLFKNWLTTLPTILVMGVILTLFYSLLIVEHRASSMLDAVSQKFSLTVYLKDDADSFEVGNLITALEQRSDVVRPVRYTSKEEALKLIKNDLSLDTNLLTKYHLAPPASLTITLTDPERAAPVQDFLKNQAPNLFKSQPQLQEKQNNITDQMIAFIRNVKNTALRSLYLFAILFLIGGALLLASAIHLGITARHREITIMNLVGAASHKITMPFVVEGIMMSILAFGVHLLLIPLLPFDAVFSEFTANTLLLEFASLLALGALVSHLTASFYLKQKITL